MEQLSLYEGHISKCFFCENVWGKCTCQFPGPNDAEAPGFDFHEFFITNPSLSVCRRYFVNPFVYYGQAYCKWEGL